MKRLEDKDFFQNIRRSVMTSHFVASIIPLALLIYFSVRYVYPYVSHDDITNVPLNIMILPVLAVIVSILGLVLTTRATNSSIASAQNLNKRLNSLFEITKQFRETLYPDILLKKILESAMVLTGGESGFLLLRNKDGDLQFKVTAGTFSESVRDKVLQPGEGIAAWVAQNGEPVLVNDATVDPRHNPEFDSEAGVHTKSVMCVPLLYDNDIIGVIELRNKHVGSFTKQDEALLHSLADQASISIAQNRSSEQQHSDFIHITEILVGAQDYIQKKQGHARRVATYANLIGKKMNLSEPALKKLYYASLLHDIGMLKIDTDDQNSKEHILQHPRLGYDMIMSISLWSNVADIVLHHHERYDGSGYPASKERDEIPLGARIVSVADTYDILTNSYSDKKQLDPESALKEIEAHAGSHFDPDVIKAFKSSITDAGISNEY
jgi:response regulator RpfG family c-di-GMP phosphodiesterase